MKFRFSLLFIILCTQALSAQDLYKKYFDQKNYKKALEIAKGDFLKNQAAYGLYHEDVMNNLSQLIDCNTALENYTDAAYYLCSLQAANQYLYGDSVEYAAYDYEQLGLLYYKNKNFLDAACCFERAFIINRRNKGENAMCNVDNLHEAAVSYEKAKELEKAERDYLLSISILKKIENYPIDKLRNILNELKHFYHTNKMTAEETGVQEALNTMGLEKTNEVKESERCDCVKHLVPSEELKKLGITP